MLGVYVLQEFLEGLLATGHPAGLAGIFGYGGWWAIPAAAAIGLVLAALLHGARWVLDGVAQRHDRAASAPAPVRHPRSGHRALHPAAGPARRGLVGTRPSGLSRHRPAGTRPARIGAVGRGSDAVFAGATRRPPSRPVRLEEHVKRRSALARGRRIAGALAVTACAGLSLPALAGAHARVSPAVSLAGQLQLYSLAVPTEKSGVTTSKVVHDRPGRVRDRLVRAAAPGLDPAGRTRAGAGNNAVVTKVTWTGGRTPTGEDSLFQFLAQPASAQTYTFSVQQTYSDGSIVNWTGPESSAAPAPTIDAVTLDERRRHLDADDRRARHRRARPRRRRASRSLAASRDATLA